MFIRFVVFVSLCVFASAQKRSPCPDVLKFEENLEEPGKWYGLVTLKSPETLKGVWLRIIFDKPVVTVGNWFGESYTSDSQKFIIKRPDYVLESGVTTKLRFFVQYENPRDIPTVKTILLNGKTVCKVGDEFIEGDLFKSKVVEQPYSKIVF